VWYIDTIQDQDPISTGGVNIHNWYQPSSDTSGVFTVNPLTGEITWTPDAVGNWVASFVVDEYRNGVKIGSIRRDMQYIVSGIQNPQPLLMGTNGLPTDAHGNIIVGLTDGATFSLTVTATDEDPVLLTANGEPFLMKANKASFVAGAPSTSVQGTLTWTPNAAQVRNRPYIMAIRTTDLDPMISFAIDHTMMLTVAAKTTGINKVADIAIQNVYPNPTADRLNVPFALAKAGSVRIDAVDMTGRIVANLFSGNMPAGMQLAMLNHNLQPGAYVLRITADGSIATKAFNVIR